MKARRMSATVTGRTLPLIAISLWMLVLAHPALSAGPQAARIDAITPSAARSGERVSISGIGFGGPNVSITVGGVAAAVVAATGNQVTFLVPGALAPGFQVVNATNPGGQTGSIGLQFLEGILLPGNANTPAINSIFDLPPVAVDQGQVANGLILTRLELRVASDATVGQVNDALVLVQGGIVSMSRGFLEMTIAVPRPATVAPLQAAVQTLNNTSGIQWAFLAREAASQVLPPDILFLDQQLLPPRFPAAWNAKRLATGLPAGSIGPITLQDCTTRKVPILVADKFIRTLPPSHIGFATEVPDPDFLLSPSSDLGVGTHGYDVTTTLAALFNDHNPTGANPFTQCLDITGVQLAGLGSYDQIDRIVRNFPSGKFILNYSNGYNDKCEIVLDATTGRDTCSVDSVVGSATFPGIATAFTRAADAIYWKLKTHTRWRDFLASASAGNASDARIDEGFVATIYPGVKQALPNSILSTATDLDPFYGFIQDASRWSNPNFPELPDLTATADEVARVRAAVVSTGMDRVGFASNILIVGSATPGSTIGDLAESRFSNAGADVLAIGENIVTFSGAEEGTSFSAPQVAGLASYLWLLSPTLRGQFATVTAQAIQANTGTNANGNEIIDAYATILSLDEGTLPTVASAPVRLAILDVNDDGKFDENDLQLFLAKYLDANGNPVEPTAKDYGRFDLNGDGFTGGSQVERFDLDRVGSTRFGNTNYSPSVTQQIEGQAITFNENAVTDMEVLCYYAYSALYTGDTAARAQLLAGCAGVQVRVTPAGVTLVTGHTQQFAARVTGAQDVRVTWAVDGVNGGNSTVGIVSVAGLYTAPSSAGMHTVQATSIADPDAFADATVTVHATGNTVSGQLSITFDRTDGPFPNGDLTVVHGDVTVFVRAGLLGSAFHPSGLSILEASGNAELLTTFTLAFGCSGQTVMLSGGASETGTITGAVTGLAAQFQNDFGLRFSGPTILTTTEPTCDGPVTTTDPPQDSAMFFDLRFILRDGTAVTDASGLVIAIDYSTTDSPEGFPRVVTGRLTLE